MDRYLASLGAAAFADVPEFGDYDVVVVGGGPAGIAASATAAELGHRTLLIERLGYCGGAAVSGMSGTICGLYLTVDEPGMAQPEGEQAHLDLGDGRGLGDHRVQRLEPDQGIRPTARRASCAAPTAAKLRRPMAAGPPGCTTGLLWQARPVRARPERRLSGNAPKPRPT